MLKEFTLEKLEIIPMDELNESVFGMKAREILVKGETTSRKVPADIHALPQMLRKY